MEVTPLYTFLIRSSSLLLLSFWHFQLRSRLIRTRRHSDNEIKFNYFLGKNLEFNVRVCVRMCYKVRGVVKVLIGHRCNHQPDQDHLLIVANAFNLVHVCKNYFV